MAVSRFFNKIRHSSCLTNQCSLYTTMASLLVPPVSVRGMTHLDRDAFTTVVNVPILKLSNTFLKDIYVLKKYFLKMNNFKTVQTMNNNEVIVYLNPNIVKKLEDISENDRKLLAGKYECFDTMNLTIKYENWDRDEILKAVLPEDISSPTSYSLVGHIAQVNLRDVHLPYKTLIGEVFLDKIPPIRTVVNKVNIIDSTYRYFTMEILAGEKNTITTAKENGCTYEFDFAQVYWNPRLSTEHERIVKLMAQDDVLYDVFAGVGPFAIYAARKRIRVLANDLNPESYKWLRKNATINKLKGQFQAFNMDGREFLRNIVKPDILSRRDQNLPGTEHIVMNLPASAVEFLDILPNWFTEEELKKVCVKPLTFHVYCFVKASKEEDICKLGRVLVEQQLNHTLSADSIVSVQDIRNVAPNKEMVRVSFLLKQSMLRGEEPATKKLKINCNDM